MSDYLQPELWSKILLKLPVISTLRCTAVCKKWRSIITSSTFISAHLSLPRQNRNPLLLIPPPNRSHDPFTFFFYFDTDMPLRHSHTLRCPFRTLHGVFFRFVGSVAGLVLLSDDHAVDTCTIILWNPSIRRSVTLPMPRFSCDSLAPSPYASMLGFGFDYATSDYKVVRLVYLREQERKTSTGYEMPPMVEVYSLRDRSWRTLVSPNIDYMLLAAFYTQCFIHGALHWIGCKMVKTASGRNRPEIGILLFDMETEEFKKMALPQGEVLSGVSPLCFSILVVGGLLCSCVLHTNPRDEDESYITIWVKRDYYADSWTKMMCLDMKELHIGVWLHLRGVCGEISMGTRRGEAWDIQVPPKSDFGSNSTDNFVFSYNESLALLDEEDRAVEEVCESLERTQLGTGSN